jgi:hypothetical protein
MGVKPRGVTTSWGDPHRRKAPAGITGSSVTARDPQGAWTCYVGPDHRQDSKGAWWMPWHQESMKGVNGCDKPRLGAE